jgi:sugar phosphate isomerase/epimerase
VADPSTVFNRVVDELNKAIQVAKTEGITMVLENEFSCNVVTGTEIGQLLQAIPDRTLMLNWDPGNCYMAGENPFPKAWDQFDHSRIGHMHLKDAKDKHWMPIGSGDIDFIGQFRALKKMGYQGTMSLETHYRNAQKDLYTSSVESMDGLMKVLEQV